MAEQEVDTMLDKLEGAMGAMELALQAARAGDRQGSSGERAALVARLQQELQSVITCLPPPVRQQISPAHPTMFWTLTQGLDAERREFIEKWADGIRKHGRDFEAWVRTRNQGDSEFRFLTDPASADARYFQACMSGVVPTTPHQHARVSPTRVARAPGSAAHMEPQRRRKTAAKRQNVWTRLASPDRRADVQNILANGRLRADGSWKVPSPQPPTSSGTQNAGRRISPKRTTTRSARRVPRSQRTQVAEDAERHRARLASPRSEKAQSPTQQLRFSTCMGRATQGSAPRESSQALLERLSSPSRIREKVTSPSRTRLAWVMSGPGSTADIGAPDLHSLEQLGETSAGEARHKTVRASGHTSRAKRVNTRFAQDQLDWKDQREAKLQQKRQEKRHKQEQKLLQHEEEGIQQQLQRARRRVAAGIDGGEHADKNFTDRSQAWLATRQQSIENKKQVLEIERQQKLNEAQKYKELSKKKSMKMARGIAPLTDRLKQIEIERQQKLDEARKYKELAEEQVCMKPSTNFAKSGKQDAVKVAAATEPNVGGTVVAENKRMKAELERAEAEYRAFEEADALELELEQQELEQQELEQVPEDKAANVENVEQKPERTMSAAALIGAKMRAAGGKMLSLQQELGELKGELSSVQLGSAAVASRQADSSREPEQSPERGITPEKQPVPVSERASMPKLDPPPSPASAPESQPMPSSTQRTNLQTIAAS